MQVPTHLGSEEVELLTQFAALRGEEISPPHDGLLSRIKSAFKP